MTERVGVLALVLVLGAAPAFAAPSEADKAEARRHFEAGVEKAKLGHYDDAITEFMRAYELSPSPTPLYNVAVAWAESGQHIQAIAMFERYLVEGGDKVPADRRAKVLTRIAQLEAKLGTIKLRVSPDAAKVILDGKPVDLATAARGIRVEAGPHSVRATSEGFQPGEEYPEVGQGTVVELTLALVPVPPPQPPTPLHSSPADVGAATPPPPALPPGSVLVARSAVVPPPSGPAVQQPASPPSVRDRAPGSTERTIGYVLAAAGAATLVAGGVLYLIAKSDRQKAVDAGCTATSCTGSGATYWQNAQDGVTRSRIAAIAGGVLVVGGVTLVLVAPATRDAPVGVAIGGRF